MGPVEVPELVRRHAPGEPAAVWLNEERIRHYRALWNAEP